MKKIVTLLLVSISCLGLNAMTNPLASRDMPDDTREAIEKAQKQRPEIRQELMKEAYTAYAQDHSKFSVPLSKMIEEAEWNKDYFTKKQPDITRYRPDIVEEFTTWGIKKEEAQNLKSAFDRDPSAVTADIQATLGGKANIIEEDARYKNWKKARTTSGSYNQPGYFQRQLAQSAEPTIMRTDEIKSDLTEIDEGQLQDYSSDTFKVARSIALLTRSLHSIDELPRLKKQLNEIIESKRSSLEGVPLYGSTGSQSLFKKSEMNLAKAFLDELDIDPAKTISTLADLTSYKKISA